MARRCRFLIGVRGLCFMQPTRPVSRDSSPSRHRPHFSNSLASPSMDPERVRDRVRRPARSGPRSAVASAATLASIGGLALSTLASALSPLLLGAAARRGGGVGGGVGQPRSPHLRSPCSFPVPAPAAACGVGWSAIVALSVGVGGARVTTVRRACSAGRLAASCVLGQRADLDRSASSARLRPARPPASPPHPSSPTRSRARLTAAIGSLTLASKGHYWAGAAAVVGFFAASDRAFSSCSRAVGAAPDARCRAPSS